MKAALLLYVSLASSPKTDFCRSYTFEKLSHAQLDKDLMEMSGLVRTSEGSLVHIQDSGNDPFLIFTGRDGRVIEKFRYADVNTDPEDLGRSECPWGPSSCLYVFDTGDNFKWRSERNIWAIEESSLRTAKARMENLVFAFPGNERVDSEGSTIVGNTIFIFTKEKKLTRVFALEKSAWANGDRVAKFIEELPYRRITGAAATKDGSRILLLNEREVIELAKEGKGKKAASSWYPYRRKIKIKELAQQEAIAYDEDQRSFLYTSEKSRLSSKEWGIMHAKCISTP